MPLFVCLFVLFCFISVMKSLKLATFNYVRDKCSQQNNAHQYGDISLIQSVVIPPLISLKPKFFCQVPVDFASYVAMSLFIFFFTLFWTRTYDMADGLVVLFAHSTFGIGLCPVDCCFYIICSYCLILCCNNKRWHCFSFKLSFF